MTIVSLRRIASIGLLLAGSSSILRAQQTPQPLPSAQDQVSFQFDRKGLTVPSFTLTLDKDGTAHYEADEVMAVRGSQSDPPVIQHLSRTITLSRSATERVFATALDLKHFRIQCASNAKNIADTGTKTLRYSGEGGEGSCTYNYSEDKKVTQLTDLFQSVARTLDMGRRLDFQHRFDRLGLDATMASLIEEVDGGRAAEVSIISPTLSSLANDDQLMQRVRQRAARLLAASQSSL